MTRQRMMMLALAAAMMLPAAGCAEYFGGIAEITQMQPDGSDSHITVTEEEASVYVADAMPIFNHLTYQPEMFYGKYVSEGTDGSALTEDAKQAFLDGAQTFTMTGAHAKLTTMPFRVDFGPHCNMTPLNYLSGYHLALLYFYDVKGEPVQVQAAYSVDGNSLNMQLIRSCDYDADSETVNYEFSGDTLKFYYTLNAGGLTLSNSTGKVQLFPEDLHRQPPVYEIHDANRYGESELLDGIESIELTAGEQYVMVNGAQCPVTGYEFTNDGIFKLKWTVDGTPHAVQTAYFYCDDDGLVLMDDTNTYLYTRRSYDLYSKDVNTNNLSLRDSEELARLGDADITAFNERIKALYADLERALETAGVSANIDPESGEIALDSVVLFAVDDSAISPEGTQMLSNFLNAYTSVIFDKKYDGFVTAVEIEGHTDPTGSEERNQELSKARAEQVMQYCLSAENGLDPAVTEKLTPMLSAQGFAAAHPIFGADGEVDLAASRRVSFRFIAAVKSAE